MLDAINGDKMNFIFLGRSDTTGDSNVKDKSLSVVIIVVIVISVLVLVLLVVTCVVCWWKKKGGK